MRIKKILFITLSNIGDVILTTPVLGALLKEFPGAEITVVVSPQAAVFFEENPALRKVVVYNKSVSTSEKIKLFFQLRAEKFDLIVDLKNTLFGFFLPAKYKTPFFRKDTGRVYKKDVFLNMLKKLFETKPGLSLDEGKTPFYIWTSEEDKKSADKLLGECGVGEGQFIAVSPFAKSDTKSWPPEKFAELIKKIKSEMGLEVVLVGTKADEEKCRQLEKSAGVPVCNLAGKTSLRVLAEVIKKRRCLVSNDSAAMHLSAAVGAGVVAIFGPTDYKKYAPRGEKCKIIHKDLKCQPCEKAQCLFGKKPADCLDLISVDEVFDEIKKIA